MNQFYLSSSPSLFLFLSLLGLSYLFIVASCSEMTIKKRISASAGADSAPSQQRNDVCASHMYARCETVLCNPRRDKHRSISALYALGGRRRRRRRRRHCWRRRRRHRRRSGGKVFVRRWKRRGKLRRRRKWRIRSERAHVRSTFAEDGKDTLLLSHHVSSRVVTSYPTDESRRRVVVRNGDFRSPSFFFLVLFREENFSNDSPWRIVENLDFFSRWFLKRHVDTLNAPRWSIVEKFNWRLHFCRCEKCKYNSKNIHIWSWVNYILSLDSLRFLKF